MEYVAYVETSTGLQALDVRGWDDLHHLVPDAPTNRIVLDALYNKRKGELL